MKIQTGWLAPPITIGGIDHLGTQLPCQLVYTQLVPGITNVTDRARYYSLYPWLIHAFDERFPSADAAQFIALFRRADFLLSLIAERHARVRQEPDFLHGAAMAGRTQMPIAMATLEAEGVLTLDDFATQKDGVATRYFKATLGGLGQYYVGVLAELGLLDTTSRDWVRYTIELGAPLALAIDSLGLSDRFWSVVTAGSVRLRDLDGLHAFCPCGLSVGSREHELLQRLFFADGDEYVREGLERRLTLALYLNLGDALGASSKFDFDTGAFRGAVYSGCLPDGREWRLPESLTSTRARWGIYQANELLSIAFQSVFSTTLEFLATHQALSPTPFASIEALASAVADSVIGDAVEADLGAGRFADGMLRLAAVAPPLAEWTHAAHEQQLCEDLVSSRRNDLTPAQQAVSAVRAVALLLIRADESRAPYEGLQISSDDLRPYPINLFSLRSRAKTWLVSDVRDAFRDMVLWCLTTHLSVALRKLRQTGRSTFRFRPGERGLELTDTPEPTRTTPRFNQSAQILMDLGALRSAGDSRHEQVEVTALGRQWMAKYAQ